jgi:hypothetical protein
MDSVNDERGQALVLAVLLLAIAAVAISGLRIMQDRIIAVAREHRAGEAAVEAATAVIADAYTAELRRVASSTAVPRPTLNVLRAITDPVVREAARAAAAEVSLLNGGPATGDPSVRCTAALIDVSLTISDRLYRAGFSGPLCSPR